MFNVVIEKEQYDKIDPLIITEDINLIIQSIEEQLYNINVSYRNNVRKIKNNLKSLEGISESKIIILEESDITDDNLIPYLTNVLEISLDCVVSTLYENKDYRPLLSTVNCLNDLLEIDHYNVKICKKVFEECKELFNIYSDVNDKRISTTSFYEIIDESIANSINHNIKTVNTDDPDETRIYNLVIENLDTLVDNDLVTTFDNIKSFSANQVTIYEFWAQIWAWLNKPWADWKARLKTFAYSVAGIGTLSAIIAKVWDVNRPPNINDFEFKNANVIRGYLANLINGANTRDSFNIDERLQIVNYVGNENTPALEREFIIRTLSENGVHNVKEWLHESIEPIKKNLEDVTNHLNGIKIEIANKSQELSNVSNQLRSTLITQAQILQQAKDKGEQELLILQAKLEDATKLYGIQIANRDSIAKQYNEMNALIHNAVGYSGLAVGMAAIIAMVAVYFISKRIFLTENSADTIKAVLALRKKIDNLRKDTVVMFPNLKIQFDQLDNEVMKCERESTRINDVIMAYTCSMKYFMGSYAIVLYSLFQQLIKDGNNLNNFNTLDSVHNFNGFSSLKTKNLVSELNSFYTLMIDYDKTMIDSFEKIFYMVKQDILQNKSLADITKRLPNQLSTGKN